MRVLSCRQISDVQYGLDGDLILGRSAGYEALYRISRDYSGPVSKAALGTRVLTGARYPFQVSTFDDGSALVQYSSGGLQAHMLDARWTGLHTTWPFLDPDRQWVLAAVSGRRGPDGPPVRWPLNARLGQAGGGPGVDLAAYAPPVRGCLEGWRATADVAFLWLSGEVESGSDPELPFVHVLLRVRPDDRALTVDTIWRGRAEVQQVSDGFVRHDYEKAQLHVYRPGQRFDIIDLPPGATLLELAGDRLMYVEQKADRRVVLRTGEAERTYEFADRGKIRGGRIAPDGLTAVVWTGEALYQFDLD